MLVGLCLQLGFSSPVRSAPESLGKELNFVFLHGGGGTACDLQLLADSITEQLPAFILNYEQANPGIKI